MTFLRTLWCCHLVTGIVTSCYPSLSRKAEPLRSGERWLKRVGKLLYAVAKVHSYDLSVYALCSWLWKVLLWFSILLFCNKLYKWSPCCVTRITFWPFRVSSHISECTWQFWPNKIKMKTWLWKMSLAPFRNCNVNSTIVFLRRTKIRFYDKFLLS